MDADEAFSNYLETFEADEGFDNFMSALRRAFMAGYRAAGGDVPHIQPILRLVETGKAEE